MPPISRFPGATLADLPEDLRQRRLAVQDKAGISDDGISDEDIRDIGVISAFFGLSNRLAHLSDAAQRRVPPDEPNTSQAPTALHHFASAHQAGPNSPCSHSVNPLTLAGTRRGDGNTAWISCDGRAQSPSRLYSAPLCNDPWAT